MTNYIIYGILIILAILFTVQIVRKSKAAQPRLLDQYGEEVIVTDETKAALIREYKLIKNKKSEFPVIKRRRIVDLVDHLVERKQIHKNRLQ